MNVPTEFFQPPVVQDRQLFEKQTHIVGIGINLKNIDPVNDQGLYVLVEKIESRPIAQCDQREPSKFEDADEAGRPRPCCCALAHFRELDCV